MSYISVMQPPLLPPGEYRYACKDTEHLRRVVAALNTLECEIIDVEREDGKSLTAEQLEKLIAG